MLTKETPRSYAARREFVRDRIRISRLLVEAGDHKTSVQVLTDCAEKAPEFAEVYFLCAESLNALGLLKEAAKFYERCLEKDPSDHLGAAVKLAILNRHHLDRMPVAYIETLFDQYAESYDLCTQSKLRYNAPQHVYNAVSRVSAKIDVALDLGCGTGLSAIPFSWNASIIDGVDISSKMLQKAKERKIYRNLHHGELVNFLSECDLKYDLIFAVDTFVYFGKLLRIFDYVNSSLNANGLFALTTQILCSEGTFELETHQRYSHTEEYTLLCGERSGFELLVNVREILRFEGARPVNGGVFVFKKKS